MKSLTLRPARSAGPVAAAVALLVCLLLVLIAPPPHVRAASSPAPLELPAAVTIMSVLPAVVGPDSVVTVRGLVRNRSQAPLRSVGAAFAVGGSFSTRSSLELFSSQREAFVGPDLVSTSVPVADELAPGSMAEFTLSVPAAQLRLVRTGVYAAGVSVRAAAGDVGTSAQAGRARMLLPFVDGRTSFEASRVAVMWPLTMPPVSYAQGRAGSRPIDWAAMRAATQSLLREADAVDSPAIAQPSPAAGRPSPTGAAASGAGSADEVRPAVSRGQVARLLVDPAVLDEAARPGAGPDAEAVLAALKQAPERVLLLPYGDVDIAAVVSSGLHLQVGTAVEHARAVARQTLGFVPRIAGWVPAGMTKVALQIAADAGVQEWLADSAVAPRQAGLTFTPGPLFTLPQLAGPDSDSAAAADTGLAADAALSRVLSVGAGSGPLAAESLQRLRAETLLIALELPSFGRGLLLSPQRPWAPSVAYTRTVLADLAGLPWVQVGDVEQASSDEPRRRLALSESGPTLDEQVIDDVRASARAELTLGSIVQDAVTVPALVRRRLALLSIGRAELRWPQALAAHRHEVERMAAAVRIVSGGVVTLSSDHGSVPVTVSNDLDVPVAVALTAASGPQATVEGLATKTVALPARSISQVQFPTTARTAGAFELRAQLHVVGDPGAVIGEPVSIRVRSTAVAALAAAITGTAVAALFALAGLRTVRRLRRAAGRGAVAEPKVAGHV